MEQAEITKLKEEQHADTVTVEFQSGYLPHRVLRRHAVAQNVVFFLLFLHTHTLTTDIIVANSLGEVNFR